jgi:hypothetical protein
MSAKETPVSVVIKELGLPSNTKYLGYVVHLPLGFAPFPHL